MSTLRPNKRLGQHFLHDQTVLGRIVDAADLHDGDRVLEIGPGLGVLTKALIERGANVTAIEKDSRFVDELSTLPIDLIRDDALEVDWAKTMSDHPWKLVANLPYNITSIAIRNALYSSHPPERVVVLIQREVAERAIELVRPRGKKLDGSLLALMVALASREAKIVCRVPRGAFNPPPKVESAVLMIEPLTNHERESKWGIDPEVVMQVAKRGFAHPRKLLASNLAIDGAVLESIGVPAKARAETLTVEQWVALAKMLQK